MNASKPAETTKQAPEASVQERERARVAATWEGPMAPREKAAFDALPAWTKTGL